MLDLLERREEALVVYQKVKDMNVKDMMRHDQFGMSFRPSAYAAKRLKTPFIRKENFDNN